MMKPNLQPISPRYVKTSRARVWQEAWEPMPWDYRRRTMCTETQQETYSSSEERDKNWRDARLDRYRQYQVHFYGSPREKELKNSYLRAQLKAQLELIEPPQKEFVKRVGESIAVAEKTRMEELQEQERNLKHRRFLSGFKNVNKRMIDAHIKMRRKQQMAELREEQHRLTLNPINWSHTLW